MRDYLACGFTVKYVGSMYPDDQQATDCIYDNMSLSTFD